MTSQSSDVSVSMLSPDAGFRYHHDLDAEDGFDDDTRWEMSDNYDCDVEMTFLAEEPTRLVEHTEYDVNPSIQRCLRQSMPTTTAASSADDEVSSFYAFRVLCYFPWFRG